MASVNPLSMLWPLATAVKPLLCLQLGDPDGRSSSFRRPRAGAGFVRLFGTEKNSARRRPDAAKAGAAEEMSRAYFVIAPISAQFSKLGILSRKLPLTNDRSLAMVPLSKIRFAAGE